MLQDVIRRYEDHRSTWRIKKRGVAWQPPFASHLENVMYFAAVCRNHIGGIIEAQGFCRKGSNPLQGEACAALLACKIEGDSLMVWQQVTDRLLSPDWLIEGEVSFIRRMLDEHPKWKFLWTLREGNHMAHFVANWCATNRHCGCISVGSLPRAILRELELSLQDSAVTDPSTRIATSEFTFTQPIFGGFQLFGFFDSTLLHANR
ncbi:hypothetical protein CJ030_MR4G009606 [Morella rubra]|uniref:RNase H type-1 domain-containing protein n=1 Tax=Morella rubra TaxID=262757 RepID=A0A6A1VWX7_9ROSI|nr:hypothetical protein CJ030_MR4G009606 [Morella rubra]